MAAPTKGTELLDLVRKSGLLELPKLDGYVTTLEKEGHVEEDPSRLASRMVKDGIITIFQARQMLRGRYRGFFLGKYKVLEPIGSGGMADVYLCEHMAMRHKVAVKILPLEKLKDPSLLGRFKREAQAIASLNHPNVVRAYDLDNEGSLHYLVTEYVDGCNLQDFIKKNGPLTPERAANYIAQASAGLQHIFESDLVHRDIKPGNLLLDRTGVVKLLDLGLARFNDIEKQDNLTRDFDDGRVLGTADYIAPEQGIKGSDVDIRADIYGLGATFYFLLKGEAPFEGATVTQKLLFHQIKEPPPLPEHVPPEMVELIKQMMAKKPAERIQTPSDIVERLLPYVANVEPPLEEEMPPRSMVLGSQPKSMGPKSSSRLSGRVAMAGPLSGTISGRLGPRSGIDPALRSTPHAGVNIPTTPNQAVTEQELLEEEDREQGLEFRDEEAEAVNSFLTRYRWPLIGGAIAVLAACIFFVVMLIKSTSDIKSPVKTRSFSNINDHLADNSDPTPSEKGALPGNQNQTSIPKWVSVKATKEAPPAKALRVSSGGTAGTHKTIKSAILAGGSDSHIVIMDPEHLEQFSVEGIQGLRNIIIEGWSATNQPVVIGYSQTSDPSKPLISLSNAAGVQLKNIVLRGNGKDTEVLKCTGECPGLTLNNVAVINCGKQAVLLQNLTGTKELPVRLNQVKSWTDQEKDSVIRMEGTCRDIIIEQCRFDGPFRATISQAGSLQNGEIKQCRFSKNLSAIASQTTSDGAASQVKIANCVFYEISASALFFTQALSDDSLWNVTDNLFLHTKRLASVRSARFEPPSGITPQWIWADDGQTAESPSVKPGTRYFRKTLTLDVIPGLVVAHAACKDHFILWINGKKVSSSVNPFFDQRVFRTDVTKYLVPGVNVLAVEATQQNNEPGNASGMEAAALMVCLYDTTDHKVLTMTDNTWKVSKEMFEGWNQKDTDENGNRWQAARSWPSPGLPHWKNAVWDESIINSLSSLDMSRVKGTGNIRDDDSSEGFPNLGSIRGKIDRDKAKHYGVDPDNDGTFLRYPRSVFLMKSGANEKPVGYPQAQ